IRQSFDRDYRLASDAADVRLTGTDSLSVYLDGAGATLRYPAAVLGTRDTELVAQHPKQGHLKNYVDLVLDPIDRELDHIGMALRDVVILTSGALVQAQLPPAPSIASRLLDNRSGVLFDLAQ